MKKINSFSSTFSDAIYCKEFRDVALVTLQLQKVLEIFKEQQNRSVFRKFCFLNFIVETIILYSISLAKTDSAITFELNCT